MFIIILLLSIFILLVYNYYVHYGKNGRLINLIPGPPIDPIIGNAIQFHVSAEDQWKLLCTIPNEYYPIFKIWIMFHPAVSIRHPDDLETILSGTKHIEKSRIYETLHPWLATGLLTSAGAKWHSRRKILTPAFHFNILNQFVEILIKEGECMTKSLKDAEGPLVKDLLPFISEYTLNAICETAMGVSLKNLGEFQQRYRNAIHEITKLAVYRLLRPWLHNIWIFSLSLPGLKQKRILKILHNFTEKIIAERKLYHERTNDQYLKNLENDKAEIDDTEVIGIKKKRLAMLDLLILASRQGSLTDSDIREEIDTFMFEGHDTTAMGIIFTLLLLAEHKDIQERVRAEVDTVMQENGGKLTMKSLQNLLYLDRCLKETLRLYPSVFFISRTAAEDVKLHSYVVPAGTILHLNIWGVHRDPNFWPNPDAFDPDRFLPEKIQNRHPYSYLPFSAGPRNCIGQRFGMLELKAVIAPLLHNFYLEPVDRIKDIRLRADLIIRPSHSVRVKFYYPILKVWLMFYPIVSIRHPDDLETILSGTKHIGKDNIVYQLLEPWLATGLLTSAGAKWHSRRKILTPAFHFNILNQFVEILIKEGECMTKSLKDAEGTVVKDLLPFISEYTLNAICETAMGVSLKNLGEFQQRYQNAIHEITKLVVYRLVRPWFYNTWIFSLTLPGFKQKRVLKVLHKFTEKIIAERKLYHDRTNDQYLKNLENNKMEIDDIEVFGTKKKRLAMLDLLILESRQGSLTDSDIREEIDTFMFGGHDTTAMGLIFTLLLLAEHKDIQERVRAEVDTVMQKNGGKLTMKSLQNLLYLDRCLKETLRLYPSAFLISRTAAEDVKLHSYVVPAGTILHLNIWGVHRDPNIWPNPDVFDPDRFLPEKIQKRHPYSYLPFSAGPRNCIGQRFAMLEMKAMIAPLVHNFYLEPVDHIKDIRLRADLIIRPSHPVRVKFVPIEDKQSFEINTNTT
ncbi:cytochrome P450 4C1-like [Nylanderia fulva]|uniref:cytochrome P450 4C1-like n=1 Tax=Nylanderia fulva TaxID=613905 RepID=UPI0010FB444D|nr:cytochrome P450 4C1-like [Nylanderia fulva]